MNRYMVISSDGHAVPRPRCTASTSTLHSASGSTSIRSRCSNCEPHSVRTTTTTSSRSGKKRPAATAACGPRYDSDRRNGVLDREGVAAEVLFPDADVLGTGRVSVLAVRFGSRPGDRRVTPTDAWPVRGRTIGGWRTS